MKILKLRLENINALKGKWQINFDDQAFDEGGIFTIIGATSAGKTTILDAICLALYGATPRLGKITKSDNALMHLGTSLCLAEVWLSINQQTYHFYFSQHRARMKSDGALQEPKREISHLTAQGSQLLATKNTHIDTLAVEILGMDFAQFTRSVMLAQGSFAAFLQASTHQRGEILEKITGTEIYAKLGILAHKTHQEKLNHIKEQRKRLSDITPPDESNLAELRQNIAQKTQKIAKQQQIIQQLDQKILLAKDYQQKRQDHAQLTIEQKNAKKALTDFANHYPKLELAPKLIPLESQYNHLTLLQKHLDNAQEKYHQDEDVLQQAQTEEKASQDNYLKAKQTNDECHQSWLEFTDTAKQVRELDIHIHFLQNQYQKIQENHQDQQAHLAQLQNKQQQAQQEIDTHQKICDELHRQITQYHHLTQISLATFKANIDHWCAHLSQLKTVKNTLYAKQQHTQKLRDTLNAAKTQAITQANTIKTLSTEQTDNLQALQKLIGVDKITHGNIDTLIAQQIHTYHTQTQAISDLHRHISELKTHQDQIAQCTAKYTQLTNQCKENQAILAQKQQLITHHQTLLEQNERQLTIARDNHALLLKLEGLQVHFDTLVAGSPCPLCGATEHPYQDNHPYLYQNQDKQQRVQALISQLEQERQHHQTALNTARTQMHEAKLNCQHHNEQCHLVEQDIHAHQVKLNTNWQHIQTLTQKFCLTIQNIHQKTPSPSLIADLTHALDGWQKHLENHQQTLHHRHNQHNQIHHKLSHLINAHAITTLEIEQTTTAYAQAKNDWQAHLQQLSTQLSTWHSLSGDIQKTLEQTCHTSLQLKDLYQSFALIAHLHHLALHLDKPTLPTLYQSCDTLIQHCQHHQLDKQLHRLYEQLVTQQHTHQQNQKNLDKHQTSLAFAQQSKQAYTKQHHEEMQKLQRIQNESHHLLTKLQSQQNKRWSYFGKDDVDTKEQALVNAKNHSQHTLMEAQKAYDHAKQHTNQLTYSLTQQKTDIKQRQDTHTAQLVHFQTALNQLGLKDSQDYLAHRLDHHTLSQLQDQHNKLTHHYKHLKQQLSHLEQMLHDLEQKYLDIKDWQINTLNQHKLAHQDTLNTLLTQLGSDKQKYQDALNISQQMQTLQADIAKSEQDIAIWAQLATLIGSHDGKKYRNFAQALTLDMMLQLSNQILIKMNNRYELIRSQNEKDILGIDVKDKYQNDTIRSSKNLSGGESFIISLALALGLSHINSQKIHIESLFLDEGFGTLDEEALDIALSTLSELEQTGKKIGIISHVTTLKERISTQIMVEKKSNGVSLLKGAGVVAQ